MCASCGCRQVNEDHGDERHITMSDLEEAAVAADVSVDEVVQNLQAAVRQEETAEASAGRRRD